MNKRKTWIAVVPVILFIMLAVAVKAGLTVNFEGWAYQESVEKMSPVLTSLVKFITHIGDPAVVIVFCLLLWLVPKARWRVALPVSITVIVSSILNFVLKEIFARQRPDILRLINETSYSFPSGHAMINASLYTMLALLVFKYIKGTAEKVILISVCAGLTAAIGYSRVYLGVHYAGDILGGWLLGFAISVMIYFMYNKTILINKQLD